MALKLNKQSKDLNDVRLEQFIKGISKINSPILKQILEESGVTIE